jgi:hypothetical protein
MVPTCPLPAADLELDALGEGEVGAPVEGAGLAAQPLTGEVRRLDLLRIEDKVSASYAGVGLDSAGTRFANEEVKRLRGPLV